MSLDFSQCRLPPFKHQREDVEWLMNNSFALIASEMRTGKSKIVVDACQFLYREGKIDTVIVVSPAPVRDVWADRTLGEIAKHGWTDVPNRVTYYHAKLRSWASHEAIPVEGEIATQKYLEWYVTNFEFLRSKDRLKELLDVCGPKTFLVIDEGSFIKSYKSLQTKACMALRKLCGRVVILNGTPIFHSPMDLFSQANLLSPVILDCPFVSQFKARYALESSIRGPGGKPLMHHGKLVTKIAGWVNLDDLQRRFEPYTVRRLQAECLDLPPKLDPVVLTATLDESWPAYKEMRDEFLVWLKSGQVVRSATAAIKTLRLSQITGGFLAGAEDSGVEALVTVDNIPDWLTAWMENDNERTTDDGDVRTAEEGLPSFGLAFGTDAHDVAGDAEDAGSNPRGTATPDAPTQHDRTDSGTPEEGARPTHRTTAIEVGREKLDVLLWFIEQRLEADENLHLVCWTRFIAECDRAVREVKKKFPQFHVGSIQGNQTKKERLEALALLHPATSPKGPVFVCGIEGTGSFGLNMTAAHTCVTMSSGYSPGRSAQTLDRVYGPGQEHPIAYYDIVAVGPQGQRTIDHDILTARRAGEDVAVRTSAAWVKAIGEE